MITKDMTIAEALRLCPSAPAIFGDIGMGCSACLAASAETIEEGALMHDVDPQELVDKLNAACGQ